MVSTERGAPSPDLHILLDGEYYVNHMDAPATLVELQENGSIPSLACLFVSHANGEARHYDYTCNDRYFCFIAEELVSWLRERNPELPPTGHLLGGTSLSGLHHLYSGGHEIRPWKEEFAQAVQWLHQEVEPDSERNRP